MSAFSMSVWFGSVGEWLGQNSKKSEGQKLNAGLEERIFTCQHCGLVLGRDHNAALKILEAKPNVRLLITGTVPDRKAPGVVFRSIAGGVLVQGRDDKVIDAKPKVVTKREPTSQEYADLKFIYERAEKKLIYRYK